MKLNHESETLLKHYSQKIYTIAIKMGHLICYTLDMKIKSTIQFVLLGILAFSTVTLSAKTTIQKNNGKWEILVDGEPFDVKGVTFGGDWTPETLGAQLKELKFLGVNSIRLWGTNDMTNMLLDSCHAYDINVMVGIWLRHGRPGMEADDSFDYLTDKKGMEDMYNGAMKTVDLYKNHPAVLTWGVGNEVYLNIATDKEKVEYSKFLERICSDIKKKDTNHPITSVEAWTFGLKWWKEMVPSVDIYGINSYGGGVNALQGELEKAGIDKPYVVTEFGVTGEWDVKDDKNGVRMEPNDQQKYDAIAKGYHDWIANKPSCLGVYVFHYSNGHNFGGPWLLLKHQGSYRPQYWATREAYTGKKPINNVPSISTFSLPDEKVKTGAWIPVTLEASDMENDELKVSFHYNQRIGSRKKKDQIIALNYRGNLEDGFEIQIPDEDGGIKVYAYVKDSYNNMGIAHTSITIDNGREPRKNLVAKAKLPFYVYKDGDSDLPYIPTAYMGNTKMLGVNPKSTRTKHSGDYSLAISYGDNDGWFGIGFVDPPDDWGERLGGYNLSGATKFSFWAKASSNNVKASIGFGLIGKDKKYYDTEQKQLKDIKLTTEWKQYTIDISGSDLSCIRSGLVIYSGGSGSPQFIWLDDVVFE